MINLINNLGEDARLEDLNTFNHVVAWFLREALKKQGHDSRFVRDHVKVIPAADHTIVISGVAMSRIRADPEYREIVRASTEGMMTLYLDAAFAYWDKLFDLIFTVVKPFRKSSEKYVYAGWGADPKHCFPQQKERTVFLDQRQGQAPIWKMYAKVLPTAGVKILLHPYDTKFPTVPTRPRSRPSWLEMQKRFFRKTWFYLETGLGESGLTRIEAATCGALIVVPKPLYRPLTLASLEHAIWTEEWELRKILKSQPDPDAISRKARAHTWDKVASRILARL